MDVLNNPIGINLWHEISPKYQNLNIIDTLQQRVRGWRQELLVSCMCVHTASLSTQIFGEETYSRAVTRLVYARVTYVCACVYYERKNNSQLGVVAATLCRGEVCVRCAHRTRGVSVCWEYIYISIYLYIHITVRISPFVALTISLIVYAAENASAPLAQCWFLCATYHDCAIFKRRIECNQFTRD